MVEWRIALGGDVGLNGRCVICRSGSHPRFHKHGYWIHECADCGHHFTKLRTDVSHTDEVYDDSYFEGGGAGYADYLSAESLLVAQGKRYGKLLQRYATPGTLLDVGSAAGFILKGLEESGWRGTGVEPNDRMAEHARSNQGVRVHTGTLEQLSTSERYDVVTMIQVVAHLYDLRTALRMASRMTKPDGYWLIEASNRDSLVARRLGEKWHMYSPPSVLHFFTAESLGELVGQYGFTEVARGRPVKWLRGNHVKSLLQHKLRGSRTERLSSVFRTIPDRTPIPYPSVDLFWAIYQKSSEGTAHSQGASVK